MRQLKRGKVRRKVKGRVQRRLRKTLRKSEKKKEKKSDKLKADSWDHSPSVCEMAQDYYYVQYLFQNALNL